MTRTPGGYLRGLSSRFVKTSRMRHIGIAASFLLAALAASALPAAADVSAGGGLWAQTSPNATGAAVLESTGKAVPVLPAEVDLTGLIPLTAGGGYALTLEARTGLAGFGAGAGIGAGRIGNGGTGGVATAFIDMSVAPLTSVELRGYKALRAGGSTALFFGVRVSI